MTISENTPWAWIAFPAPSILFVALSPFLGIGKSSLVSPAALLSSAVMIVIMFGTSRTNTLYGFVHLVVFATFLVFTFIP